MNDSIKYLYSQFILRDVLSFITPGAIVVFTGLYLYFPELREQQIHWLLFIPLFGVIYMVGFAVQCFGEIFDGIRFTPNGQGGWGQRFRIFWVNWADKRNIWWQEDYENDFDFFQATKGKEYEGIGRAANVWLSSNRCVQMVFWRVLLRFCYSSFII